MAEKMNQIDKIMKDTKFSVNLMDKKLKNVFRDVSPRFLSKEK